MPCVAPGSFPFLLLADGGRHRLGVDGAADAASRRGGARAPSCSPARRPTLSTSSPRYPPVPRLHSKPAKDRRWPWRIPMRTAGGHRLLLSATLNQPALQLMYAIAAPPPQSEFVRVAPDHRGHDVASSSIRRSPATCWSLVQTTLRHPGASSSSSSTVGGSFTRPPAVSSPISSVSMRPTLQE